MVWRGNHEEAQLLTKEMALFVGKRMMTFDIRIEDKLRDCGQGSDGCKAAAKTKFMKS